MSPLQLFDTRTRAKQTFVPANPSGHLGVLVCGPTAHGVILEDSPTGVRWRRSTR